MKIGILLLNNDPSYRGGVNSYIHGLLTGFKDIDTKNKYYLFIFKKNQQHYEQYKSEHIHIITFTDDVGWIKKIKSFLKLLCIAPFLRKFYAQLERLLYKNLSTLITTHEIDIYYSPVAPFFPLGIEGKIVVSPHDIQQVHFPEYFSLRERWERATFFPLAFKKAAIIQASTNFMKEDFKKNYELSDEKIRVIPEGVMNNFLNFSPNSIDNEAFKEKFQIPDPYVFYPAQHWPHKNHRTLILAVDFLNKKYHTNIQLVFTGEQHKKFQSLYNFIQEGNYTQWITFLGNIKFSELLYAYKNALAVAIPVMYESSSLPVKEAMAACVPVLASRNGSNEEININDNILLFNTYDHKELAEEIYTLYTHAGLRNELIEKSKKIIAEFTWDKIAERYLVLFNELKLT